MIETNSIKAWYLAARPKTLTAAAVPVLLGIALAYKDAQQIQTLPALLCLLFAWVMQIDSNLVNDYFLGDPEEIKKLMEAVANQGKKK